MPHPELIKLLPRPKATVGDLHRLFEMQLDLSRKWAAGPYNDFDGYLLEKWIDDVRDMIMRVEYELEARISETPLRHRFAAALRHEIVVNLNASDIDSPAFERFVRAMEAVP